MRVLNIKTAIRHLRVASINPGLLRFVGMILFSSKVKQRDSIWLGFTEELTAATHCDGSIHVEGEGIDLSDVMLQAPIPRPTGTIMCIGKNYLDHVKEVDTWKTAPGITQPEAPKVIYIHIEALVLLFSHVKGRMYILPDNACCLSDKFQYLSEKC